MYTLTYIKNQASILRPETVTLGKEYCRKASNFSLWWALDCIQNYQIFNRSSDKIFWWRMVIRTLRHANDYVRIAEALKNDL